MNYYLIYQGNMMRYFNSKNISGTASSVPVSKNEKNSTIFGVFATIDLVTAHEINKVNLFSLDQTFNCTKK